MLETKRESIIFFAATSALFALGAFILWGPTFRRKRKGHICGLVNLGYTCFLNTLLQALASCPIVLDWLSKQQNGPKRNSLITSLQNTLQVLNGKGGHEDPYTPANLIQSLFAEGWEISPGEQDAHELFHVIVTSLEEETQQPLSKVCSLSDAVENNLKIIHSDTIQQTHSPVQLRATMSNLDNSVCWQEAKLKGPLPFQGLYTSQLQCLSCRYKSPVRYTTFYSLSLVLPPRLSTHQYMYHSYTLQELLANFVANRVVNKVACDGCGRHDTEKVKSLNLGKLPPCLCIHIARTTWDGEPLKRDDHVDFPEILTMDPYTYSHLQQRDLRRTRLMQGDQSFSNGYINVSSPTRRYKHVYQLVSVVVHKGGVLCGHFITYRRGIGRNYTSWYYTSDTEVRETTVHEVMQASAYMLFYSKVSESSSVTV